MITTLINEHLINLDLKATRKEEVFTEMARLLASQGKVSDEQAFIKDLWAREELGNTGFEEGVALPTPRVRRYATQRSPSASAATASSTAPKMASRPIFSS